MAEVIPELPVIKLPETVGVDNVNPSGRVIYTKNPQALPANCAVCRRHADGKVFFIDFGFFIEYYGQVYFCEECLTPVAEACDYIPANEFRRVAEFLNIAIERGKALQKENERLSGLLNGLLGYKPSDEHKLSFEQQIESELSEKSPEPEQRTPESTPESRRTDVPKTPIDDEPTGGISL